MSSGLLNDPDVHPTGVQAGYPGVANPTGSNAQVIPDSGGAIHQATEPSNAESAAGETIQTAPSAITSLGGSSGGAKQDVIEGKPGIIDSTELAPLGDEKVAADPGLISQATSLGKKAYEAVLGDGK